MKYTDLQDKNTAELEKMLKDCMTEVGFWNDDAQVVVEHVEKLWSDDPTGISIEINVLSKLKEEL
jgi:Holliday junction resolvase RusA-like endonuclease